MIGTVTETLTELGIPPNRYTPSASARRGSRAKPRQPLSTATTSATVTVVMDGHKKRFEMSRSGINIVDAAAAQGVELPYSCKGGVCATCRTHVRQGEVDMATNYGLEPWEIEKGFVLAFKARRSATTCCWTMTRPEYVSFGAISKLPQRQSS